MKRRDLEKHLHEHGCELHHHGARHDYWMNLNLGNQAPIKRHREIQNQMVGVICKQLGVPKPDRL